MKQLNFYADEWNEFLENIDFTDKELRIIALVRRGWYQEDIASELYICRRTVARCYSSITNKIMRYLLNCRNKSHCCHKCS